MIDKEIAMKKIIVDLLDEWDYEHIDHEMLREEYKRAFGVDVDEFFGEVKDYLAKRLSKEKEIYGSMYGGEITEDNKVIKFCYTHVEPDYHDGIHWGRIVYIWGGRGDVSNYYFSDYGKTWAFSEEELPYPPMTVF